MAGIGSSTLENRALYYTLEKDLSENDLLLLMYAINPASRLTAVESFLRLRQHKGISEKEKQWINRIYDETPIITTMRGCIEEREDSKKLVAEFLKLEP